MDKTIRFYILSCLERNTHEKLRLFEIANASTSKWIRLNFPCDTMREEDNLKKIQIIMWLWLCEYVVWLVNEWKVTRWILMKKISS